MNTTSSPRPPVRPRIDVHHHILPPAFLDAVAKSRLRAATETPIPDWTIDRSLAVMDAQGIELAVVSISAPGVVAGDAQEGQSLARSCNEYAAELRVRHPGRFGSFAALPAPFADAACHEAVHALDQLGADGVVLFGSTDGRFLGDPSYDALMSELDAREAVVLLHPNLHPASRQLDVAAPSFLLELPCDTTRAALQLILTGTIERFPRIRWILANAGGFLPYVAWRLALANAVPGVAERAPRGVLGYARGFYYDTALAPSRYSMAALRELVPESQILFGSDFPFAPEPLVELQCRTLEQTLGRRTATHDGIARGNAANLFPRLRSELGSSPGWTSTSGRRPRASSGG